MKPCNESEVAFYNTALAHPEFAAWMPTYFGTLSLNDPTDAVADRTSSLVLQNLTFGFVKPCILDAKLGAQLWDDAASPEKRARLDAVSDVTTSRSLGMRVAGMRVWKPEQGEYKSYDKQYGRTFTAENAIEMLKEYVASGLDAAQVAIVAKRFRDKVAEVETVIKNQESRMYSASLLFVYEGDSKAFDLALADEKMRAARPVRDDDDESEDDDDEKAKLVEQVKLIDFAHAQWTPGLGPDENVLQGVRSIEMLLAELAVAYAA